MKRCDLKCPVCGLPLKKRENPSNFGELFVACETGSSTEYDDSAHTYTCENKHTIYFGDIAEAGVEE